MRWEHASEVQIKKKNDKDYKLIGEERPDTKERMWHQKLRRVWQAKKLKEGSLWTEDEILKATNRKMVKKIKDKHGQVKDKG